MDVWRNSVKEHQLSQSTNFLSMLAINLRQPETALDILPTVDKYYQSKHVRILALLNCGHFEEMFHIVKNILTEEQHKNARISVDLVRSNQNWFSLKKRKAWYNYHNLFCMGHGTIEDRFIGIIFTFDA